LNVASARPSVSLPGVREEKRCLPPRRLSRRSGGAPFTAADIEDWYKYEVLFFDATPRMIHNAAGQGEVVKLDDHTVKFVFKEPNALFIEKLASIGQQQTDYTEYFVPSHYIRQFHPKLGNQEPIKRYMQWFQLSSSRALPLLDLDSGIGLAVCTEIRVPTSRARSNHPWGIRFAKIWRRAMRANLLDELRKPYVTTARAKGVRPLKLLFKYPVRLALNPFISGLDALFPQLVLGGAIVALVLSLSMVGPVMLDALLAEDVYLAGSMLVVMSVLGVFGNLVSDLLLLCLDPRIRIGGGSR